MEKKRQADKAEEERIAKIKKMLEIKKKEKAQTDQKRQNDLEKKKKEEARGRTKKRGKKERGRSCQEESRAGGAKGGKTDKANYSGNCGVNAAGCSASYRG